MKNKLLTGGQYVTPQLSALEVKTEGVLCASEGVWYEKSGSGDFDYSVETDSRWM